MTNNQLQRVIRFIKKSGDKAVVLDPNSDDVLVLMSLDNYEDLVVDNDLFEPDPAFNDSGVDFPSFDDLPILDEEAPEQEVATPQDLNKGKKLEFESDWTGFNVNNNAEESLADVPHEEEEEKFYLEPVE